MRDKALEIISPAKINLSLKVLKKLTTGYHLISSHVIFINLFDRIFIKTSNSNKIKIVGPYKDTLLKNGGDLLIHKTLKACQSNGITKDNFNILLEKNIPVSAGLGGGSSNSASIIRYFMFGGKKDKVSDVIEFSKSFGADVPACLYSRPLLMEGIGEKLSFINCNKELNLGIVLINPKIQMSTKDIFEKLFFDQNKIQNNIRFLTINNLKTFSIISNIGNDLKDPALKIAPVIKSILIKLNKNKLCIGSGMSGSGPTCYGLFESVTIAKTFELELKNLSSFQNFWIWSGGMFSQSNKKMFLPID